METKINIKQEKSILKTSSENELLETYNRRDITKIPGFEHNLADDQRTYQTTAEILHKLAQERSVRVERK